MAKRKIKSYEPLPIRNVTHIKEDDSNDIFREAIKPWMFRGAVSREYGIDGTVEIIKPLSTSRNQIVTGKRFSIQLKSSDSDVFDKQLFSLSVPRDKINYWYNALEPVLIVFIDLQTKSCFYRWIDENLIQELFHINQNWIAQETVSIKFDKEQQISSKSLLEIERYVLNWKRPAKTILTPGNYFKFSKEAKSYIDAFASIAEKNEIRFLSNEIDELKLSASQSIYTVAVVGPNKAGKSTLINSLLHKMVSPVGMLPTTGIPITIFPSNENKSVVLFKNNKEISGGVDEDFLREYTSKDKNPNNEKEVKIVSVEIINTLLERGISICDVPGLDDADPEVRQITKTALFNVNAIIYLISAAPMLSGDFSLNKQIIEDLKELGGKMDRLFLVFNKIDLLSEEQLKLLKEYVNETLTSFHIIKYLPTEPIYISSQQSFDNRIKNKNTNDSVGNLEKEVWEYLLIQNKTGLHKIIGSFGDCLVLSDKMKKIITTRMIDAEKRIKLENEIGNVSTEISELRCLVDNNRQQIYSYLYQYLVHSFTSILEYLRQDLDSISTNTPLPNNHQITTWLQNNAFKTISEVYSHLDLGVSDIQSTINTWVSQKLKQVEIGIENPDSGRWVNIPEISQYTNQIHRHYFGSGYLGVWDSFFASIGNFITNIVDSIVDAFTSDIVIRDRQKQQIILKSQRSYDNIATECLINIDSYLRSVCKIMEDKSIDRAKVYLGELSFQLQKLNQPISKTEQRKFENFLNELEEIDNGIGSNLIHLKAYSDGIEWMKNEN